MNSGVKRSLSNKNSVSERQRRLKLKEEAKKPVILAKSENARGSKRTEEELGEREKSEQSHLDLRRSEIS